MARSLDSLRREIERRIGAGRIELPPLPEVAQLVLKTAADPMAAASDLADLVHRDPGLATAILRDSNSAFKAGRVQIVSLQQAISRLGVQRVVEIAISASVRDGVFSARGFESELRRLWRRSLGTGFYAKEVARVLRADVESAFLAGLLRRVGTALLYRALSPLRKPRDAKLPAGDLAELNASFRVRFGQAAAESWNLPSHVRECISYVEGGDFRNESMGVLVVVLAERLVDLIDTEDQGKEEALRSDPLLDELGIYSEDLETLLDERSAIRRALENTE